MKIDLTKEEITLSIALLDKVTVTLSYADTLLKLRNKYKRVLEMEKNK